MRALLAGRRRWVALLTGCLLGGIAIGVGGGLLTRPHAAAPVALPSGGPVIGASLARQNAPQFQLTDQNGATVSLQAEKGKVVLLAFMDPRCVQLCPVLGRNIATLEQQLPSWVHPELLIVSVESGRTRADVQHFVATNLTTPWKSGWHWLIGPNDAALKLTWIQWGVQVSQPHDNLLAVIDREGYLRVEYPAPLLIDDALNAITTVARQ